MKNYKKQIFTILFIFCIAPMFAVTTGITDEVANGVDRYAIFIGSNKGGKGRDQLLYAGSDAKNFQKAMSEIGGLSDSNSFVLIDPSKEKIDETLSKISQKISSSAGTAKRSEFLFYYSGHSDENSLLLGDTPYEYSTLKAAITDVPSDIHVVILDSCYSGNFIRTKGGQKRKPFLLDDSSVVTGHAYLSSSSTNEYSQESDEIEASYFTNAMITGLRGAADTSGDNKVTLNELYSYAFNETLSKTESSKAGPQHPNYNITLVGSGDLVLSDISTGESMLSLSKDAKGKFIIRNEEGKLISEINKSQGQPIFMALSSGQYSAVIIDEYSTKQGTFILEKNKLYVLDQNSLTPIKRKTNRIRGTMEDSEKDESEDINDDDDEILPIDDLVRPDNNRSRRRYQSTGSANSNVSSIEASDESASDQKDIFDFPSFDISKTDIFHFEFVPGVTIVRLDGSKGTTFMSVGLLGSLENNIMGFQISNIMNIANGYVFGIQSAGIFNTAKEVLGAQTAGLFNISKDITGGQASGLFNIANGNVNGAQVTGLFNISSGTVNGGQISGLANIGHAVDGIQATGLLNVAKSVNGIQIGVINVADVNNGIALGLFNFIRNGVHDFGISINSNDMIDLFYQSGTNALFFTLGAEASRLCIFDRNNASFIEKRGGLAYAGIGSRLLPFSFLSFDFEFLWKVYIANFNMIGQKPLAENFIVENIPSLKLTINCTPGRHFALIGGVDFNINIHDYNERAFLFLPKNMNLDINSNVSLKPAFFFGFKLK